MTDTRQRIRELIGTEDEERWLKKYEIRKAYKILTGEKLDKKMPAFMYQDILNEICDEEQEPVGTLKEKHRLKILEALEQEVGTTDEITIHLPRQYAKVIRGTAAHNAEEALTEDGEKDWKEIEEIFKQSLEER